MKAYLDHLPFTLVPVDDDLFNDAWFSFGDSFLDVPPPLLGTAAAETTDGLVPLPESLSEFDQFSSLPSLYPPIADVSTALGSQHDSVPQFEDLSLGDVDFDSLTWDDNLLEIDNGNLSICNQIPLDHVEPNCHPNHSLSPPFVASNIGQLVPCDEAVVPCTGGDDRSPKTLSDERRRRLERRASGRCSSRLNDISFEEIKNYFYMPITRAAKEMNVGLTVLKKRCRMLGISRWPHRKMKSLKSLIHNVQELGQEGATEEVLRTELERLEEHRRLMEENPEIQLTERTKRLRQACFKANYKKRRLLQCPDLDNYPFMIS